MKKTGSHYYNGRRQAVKPTKRRPHPKKYMKRKLNKKKVAVTAIIFLAIIMSIVKTFKKDDTVETATNNNNQPIITNKPAEPEPIQQSEPNIKNEITDWRLTLANYENILPEGFEVELEEIADGKQFDSRAIKDLKAMINSMRRDGISNVWVQSAYRSVERQKELYNNSIQKYLKQGKTQEEAERLTDEYINKPGASDHNLGLAVDFNNVDNNFEDLKAFKWLKENAEDYGFI
jgi:D-alanyl-D-alanine carboxypeptidase